MAEQLLNRLINAIESFSIGNQTQGQKGRQPTQTNSVDNTVRRLYPSVDSNANATARDLGRIYVSGTNNFLASNNYRPGNGKRMQAQSRGQKSGEAEEGKSKPATLKT